MKRLRLLLLICSAGNSGAQSGGKSVRIGLVPYQLLARSSGVYVSFKTEKSYFEYRPTYTYCTNYQSMFQPKADFFFFRGINQNLVFKFNNNTLPHTRFLLIQRTWCYNNKYFEIDNIISSKSQVLRRNQSALVNGGGLGLEFFRAARFGAQYGVEAYVTLSGSYMKGYRKILNYQPIIDGDQIRKREFLIFNFALGIKI